MHETDWTTEPIFSSLAFENDESNPALDFLNCSWSFPSADWSSRYLLRNLILMELGKQRLLMNETVKESSLTYFFLNCSFPFRAFTLLLSSQ